MDVHELLRDRMSSIFEFMNEDKGGRLFGLEHSTSILTRVLQCFTIQDHMHAAVTDKFKRRVIWHRSNPFEFPGNVDTNGFFFISGMLFAQKLQAAPEIKQCIEFCRKKSWCPSSISFRLQQQNESCFMSALLLHTACVAHPLFTFSAVIADAVPKLLTWLQRTILLTASIANPTHMVTIQPQSQDTWVSPALPLEVHTLVHQNVRSLSRQYLTRLQERLLACLALMSQIKQGVDLLRSDDSMSCIARVWDALNVFCACVVRREGSTVTVAITQHLMRMKGTAVVVACIANILGMLANIALDQSGCVRVSGIVSPQAILDCLALELSLWNGAISEINSSEISSHPNADILPAMLICASSSSNACTVASQASALLTNMSLNKTACSAYCTHAPLLVALEQARKTINDAGARHQSDSCMLISFYPASYNVFPARTFLFYTSHELDWSPLLQQWSSRHSMHDALGGTLTAVAMVDVAIDRLQSLQLSASSSRVLTSSTTGILPVSHLENFLNVAAFRGDAAKAGITINMESAIGDTTEDDHDSNQSTSKLSLSSAKSRTWGRVVAAVKKTKNVKQIPQDCGIYALAFSYRTPSLDDPDVVMALGDRATLMEFTSGFKNMCGLSRRPCATVACPTQNIWQKCQPVLVLNLGLGTQWAVEGSMIACSNIVRNCSLGRCCVRSMEWMLWVIASLGDRPSSDMLLKLCASQILTASSLSSLLSWCFSGAASRFNFDANRTSRGCVLACGGLLSGSRSRGIALLQDGCGCSVCCRVFAIAVISEICASGGGGGLGPLLQDEMRKCGLLSVIDDAVCTQQRLEHESLMSCRSICSRNGNVATEALRMSQPVQEEMSMAEAAKLQMNASGIRLIASSLMVLMSSVFSNKSFLDALATADTSGSSLIKNIILLLRSSWTHEIADFMTLWASDSIRGVISVTMTDRPSNLLAFSTVQSFAATACDVITFSPYDHHAFAIEEKRPFIFSMPWQKGSACLVLQALMEAFHVRSYAQVGCVLVPSLVGQVFQPCTQLLACMTRSCVSSRKSDLAHWESCRLMLIALRQFCGCCNTLLLDCMWRRRCAWLHNLHLQLAAGVRDLVSIRRCLSNAIASAHDAAFKAKLAEILDLVLVVCSTASLSFSHFLLDEHVSAELIIINETTCEQFWMLTVMLWEAQGTAAVRSQYKCCAAALICCLMASHPKPIMALQDPICRLGKEFVPDVMKQLQHSPTWHPSGDGSCKRQLSGVLACAASAFDFDNEFAHIHPAKFIADGALLLLEGDDMDMMQRALNTLQVMARIRVCLRE